MRLNKMFNTYNGLPRSIYVLFASRIVNSMGSFVYPFLTLFLTDKMGMGEQATGIYFMISAVVGVPGSFLGGYLADRYGRKKVMVLSQGLAALAFASCAFLENSMIIPRLLITASFFGGVAQPAYSAMIADLTNEENRKQAFSLLYLGINLGYSVGPLIAGFLYNNYIEWIFLGDALTTIISLILVMVNVTETIPSKEKMKESYHSVEEERAEQGSLVAVLLKRPTLLVFTVIFIVYNFVYVQHSYSITLQLKELFGPASGAKMFGTIMASNGFVVLLFTTLITKVTVKLKPIQNITIAGILFGIGFGSIYFASSFYFIWILTLIWTIGEILESTNAGVYIANHTPMSHRGRFNSVIPIITGLGYSAGPFLTGGYIEKFGVRMVWPLTFMLAIIASSFMYLLYLVEKGKIKEEILAVEVKRS